MLFRVFMLLSLYVASAYSQDFVCGYDGGGDEVTGLSSHHIFYRSSMATDPIKVLVLFGKFVGDSDRSDLRTYKFADRDNNTTRLSTQFVDPTVQGSLAHYFEKMSYGNLHLASADDDAPTTWYEGTAKPTLPTGCPVANWGNAVRDFSRAVLDNAYADPDVDFTDVDLVAVLTPPGMGNDCKVDGTVFGNLNWRSRDRTTTINRVITSDWDNSFPFIVGVLAHEYGHVMGLLELYDRTNILVDRTDYPNHSAGVGFWGVMGKGSDGYVEQAGVPDGPTPLSAWSRIEVGWLDNRVETVSSDKTVTIPDINSSAGNVVVQIPVPGSSTPPMEYFLLSNRQNTYDGTESSLGSYYDAHAPQRGLLIWHIDETVTPHLPPTDTSGNTNPYRRGDVNAIEEHKRVDVECADGLWDHPGPGATSIPLTPTENNESGGDNLDYWTGDDKDWRDDRQGNLGDAGDVWTSGEFTPTSNPSTAGYNRGGSMSQDNYSDDTQDVFTGIAVRNITQTNGEMRVDIRFIPSAPSVDAASLRQGTGDHWNEVTLSWTAPAVNNTNINGYEYCSTDCSNNEDWTGFPANSVTTNTGRITLPSDANTVEYSFQVRAVTPSEEAGTPSAAVGFTLDRPGAVGLAWSGTVPEVGQSVTAELTDPNGVVGVPVWQWERGLSATDTWTTIGSAHASYTPQRDDIGHQLRATAHYTDRHGSNKSASGATSASVVGRPSAPREFEAVAGDGQVVLRWQPPASNGGLPIRRYKVVYFPSADRDASTGFSAVPGGASARDTTIEGLTNGTRYVFRVLAQNRDNNDGNGFRAEREATPQVPCQLTGATDPTFAENATGVVSTYTASAGCDSALSWGLAGTDECFFQLKGDGMSRTLEFDSSHSPPNFEQPADAGKNNTYAVSVSIGDVSVSVTVSVTDANDAGVIRLSTTAPRAEESLTATLSDEDGIAEPVYWTPHYESTSDGGGVTGQASEATQTWTLTIPNSRVGQSLRLQADYTDSFGSASAMSALTSPVRPAANRAPSVSGPAAVDIAENSSEPWLLGTYTGRDPDGDELTWSVTGTDASAFELKEPASPGAHPSRELHLASAADYETQASYDVWVKVSDAALSDSLRVSVSVVNQNEDGEVVLRGGLPPEVGTAVVAGLTDPDGQITGAAWQWQRRLGATGAWEAIGSGVSGASSAVSGTASAYPELSSYTPVSGDVGWQLQATVRYRDGHDPNAERMSASDPSRAVVGVPVAPSEVSFRSGWTQVRVEWSAVATATGYAVQGQSKPFDGGTWPSTWTSLASDVVGQRRYVHRGVSPDSLYRYQVRARVGELESAWSSAEPSAGVQPGVGPPTGFTAEAGASEATLRWTGPDHASIIKWRYRDVTAEGADTDGGWLDATVSSSAVAGWSAPVEGLTAGREYRFQVRAVNGAGDGRPSAVSNTVTPWLARPTGGSVSVQAGPALKVAWSAGASATGYEVQGQSKAYDGGSWPSAWTTQQAHGAQPYVHRGVDADRRYRYRVRARVGETVSAWSDTLPGVAGVQPPPGAPMGLTATPGIRQATLRWTGPTHTSITEWQYKRGRVLEPTTAFPQVN